MLGEQLCQNLACFWYLCSSHEINHWLLDHPEFRGLSFTHNGENLQNTCQNSICSICFFFWYCTLNAHHELSRSTLNNYTLHCHTHSLLYKIRMLLSVVLKEATEDHSSLGCTVMAGYFPEVILITFSMHAKITYVTKRRGDWQNILTIHGQEERKAKNSARTNRKSSSSKVQGELQQTLLVWTFPETVWHLSDRSLAFVIAAALWNRH